MREEGGNSLYSHAVIAEDAGGGSVGESGGVNQCSPQEGPGDEGTAASSGDTVISGVKWLHLRLKNCLSVPLKKVTFS